MLPLNGTCELLDITWEVVYIRQKLQYINLPANEKLTLLVFALLGKKMLAKTLVSSFLKTKKEDTLAIVCDQNESYLCILLICYFS